MILTIFCIWASVDRFTQVEYKQKYPTMKGILFLFDPWCHHCQRARPHWQEFAKRHENLTSFLIAEINCPDSPLFCGMFPSRGFPAVYYVDRKRNITDKMEGEVVIDTIEKFYRRHITNTMIKVENEIEIQEQIRNIKQTSLFIYTHPNPSNETFDKIVEEHMFDTIDPIPTFLSRTGTKYELTAIRDAAKDVKTTIELNPTNDSIGNFISLHALSLLPEFDLTIKGRCNYLNDTILVFVIPNQNNIDSIKSTIASISRSVQFTYSLYDKNSPIVNMTGLRKNKKNNLLAVNFNEMVFSQYSGPMNTIFINRWLSNQHNWRWYKSLVNDPAKDISLTISIIGFSLFIVFLVVQTVRYRRRHSRGEYEALDDFLHNIVIDQSNI